MTQACKNAQALVRMKSAAASSKSSRTFAHSLDVRSVMADQVHGRHVVVDRAPHAVIDLVPDRLVESASHVIRFGELVDHVEQLEALLVLFDARQGGDRLEKQQLVSDQLGVRPHNEQGLYARGGRVRVLRGEGCRPAHSPRCQ